VAPAAPLVRLTALAKGLAHPTRLRLLGLLAGGELCVCQLIAVLGLAPSTVSAHLTELKRGALLAERKAGKLVFYRWADGPGAAALLPPLQALLAADPTVAADARLARSLRRIGVAKLCAAELDLVALGLRRAAAPPVLAAP